MNSGSIPNRDRDFSLLHHVQTGSGAHQTSYPVGTGDLSLGVKWTGMKLTSHLHLVPKLNKHETILLLCLHGITLD
jgi:hypothetical protein